MKYIEMANSFRQSFLLIMWVPPIYGDSDSIYNSIFIIFPLKLNYMIDTTIIEFVDNDKWLDLPLTA